MPSEAPLREMAKRWPSTIVARSSVKEFSGGLFSPGTLANADSRGEGPEGRLIFGRKTAYPVDALIDWMASRMRSESDQSPYENRKK